MSDGEPLTLASLLSAFNDPNIFPFVIAAITPPGPSQSTADIVVATSGGWSQVVPADQFTYTPGLLNPPKRPNCPVPGQSSIDAKLSLQWNHVLSAMPKLQNATQADRVALAYLISHGIIPPRQTINAAETLTATEYKTLSSAFFKVFQINAQAVDQAPTREAVLASFGTLLRSLRPSHPKQALDAALRPFADASSIPSADRTGVSEAILNHLVPSGSTLKPESTVTLGEYAAYVVRFVSAWHRPVGAANIQQ
jgi:hypothetical protein